MDQGPAARQLVKDFVSINTVPEPQILPSPNMEIVSNWNLWTESLILYRNINYIESLTNK